MIHLYSKRPWFDFVLPQGNKTKTRNTVIENEFHLLPTLLITGEAGIDQSVQRRATAWMVGVGAGDISLHYSVQADSGAHLTSYAMGIGRSFRGGNAAEA
jgi:hypothetical protein